MVITIPQLLTKVRYDLLCMQPIVIESVIWITGRNLLRGDSPLSSGDSPKQTPQSSPPPPTGGVATGIHQVILSHTHMMVVQVIEFNFRYRHPSGKCWRYDIFLSHLSQSHNQSGSINSWFGTSTYITQ